MTERGSWSLARQCLVLLWIAAAGGTGAQLFSPTAIPWREDWSRYVQTKALKAGLPLASVAEAAQLVAEGRHLIFDARPASDYNAGHLPGALSLPQAQLESVYPQFAPLLRPAQPVLVYCSGHACDESYELSLFLQRQGCTNVVLFVGGMAEWTAAGQAVER